MMTKNNSSINDLHESSLCSSRRKFVKIAGASLALLSFPLSTTFAFAKNKKVGTNPKIVWIVLRGALDSLHTIVPTSDEHYKVLRPKLSSSFKSPLLPLEKGFALHPSLKTLHQWYQDQSLLPIVAVTSGYQERSHFDGQDFLESGKGEIDHDSGWLARAMDSKAKRGLAVSRSIPISLRSGREVNTWYPSKLKNADDDIYSQLTKLYQTDPQLKETLESGLAVRGLVGTNQNKSKQQGQFVDLAKACAKLLINKDEHVDCAMLEIGGWDTHNNQSNRLERKFDELDQGLAELKKDLGSEWQNTVVIIGTEFGRTAKENGTGGTDHGTASALFLAGGAVQGGKVLGEWPGLATEQLYEQRDLMPTSNSYSWIGNVLAQHWQLSEQEIMNVFPSLKAYNEPLIKS